MQESTASLRVMSALAILRTAAQSLKSTGQTIGSNEFRLAFLFGFWIRNGNVEVLDRHHVNKHFLGTIVELPVSLLLLIFLDVGLTIGTRGERFHVWFRLWQGICDNVPVHR